MIHVRESSRKYNRNPSSKEQKRKTREKRREKILKEKKKKKQNSWSRITRVDIGSYRVYGDTPLRLVFELPVNRTVSIRARGSTPRNLSRSFRITRYDSATIRLRTGPKTRVPSERSTTISVCARVCVYVCIVPQIPRSAFHGCRSERNELIYRSVSRCFRAIANGNARHYPGWRTDTYELFSSLLFFLFLFLSSLETSLSLSLWKRIHTT